MERRAWLKMAAAGSAALAQAVGASVAGAREAARVSNVFAEIPFDLSEVTVAELQSAMQSGARTAASITRDYLARIAALDRNGPAINSIIELNPDAPSIAEVLDRERQERGPRGPLHGIPVLVKDNLDSGDRMRTTAGSLALDASNAGRDCFVVERLRAAGCVLLGKTNLSEWANFRSSRSTSGWSARGGQTRNPYALDRNTSGSSSGSAAAIAANLCVLAVGTETDGSIVSPSSTCGIVGIKPTVGLVSRSGIVPIAASQDTAGPMARTVADAAVLLGAITGVDPRDASTLGSRGKAHVDYTRFLDRHGLKGARIGIAREFFGANDRLDRVIDESIIAMRHAGAVIVDPVRIATKEQLSESEYEVLLYEFKAGLNDYLSTRDGAVRSLADLIAFNERNAAREMPYFGQERLIAAQEKGPLTESGYRRALSRNRRLSRLRGIDATLARDRLDAIVAPTEGPAWLTDLVTGDHEAGGCSQLAAVAGYPHITVPAGLVFGLPVGVSFFASAYSEPVLIKLAYAYEQATTMRRLPQFSASALLI